MKMTEKILSAVIIPENSFKCVPAYDKLVPGEYFMNKNHLESGLCIADGPIQTCSFEDRIFPITEVIITDSEIREGINFTTAEACDETK